MTNTTTNPEIARTILRQFPIMFRMLGARDVVDLGNGVHFTIPTSPRQRIRKLRITLAADDTYTVEGFTSKALTTGEPTFSLEGVYVENVPSVIEAETGYYTRL